MRPIALFIAVSFAACSAETSSSAAPSPEPPAIERLVFVGTYAGEPTKGIYAFRFNDQSGSLTPAGLRAEMVVPSFLASSADGRFLYAANEIEDYGGQSSGSVSAFAVDRSSGRLTLLNVVSSRGALPNHLALDRTGRFLAVANYSGGTFAIFPVGADGRLGAATTVLDRGASAHPHAVAFDPANRFLIGADLGMNRVVTYQFDQATGVAKMASEVALAPGAGPRHVAFHPTQPVAFSINEQHSTVTTFSWDAVQGRLQARASVPTLPAGFNGGTETAEIAVHPSGRFLYGSNRGHDSIVVYRIGAGGALTLVEHELTGGRTPSSFAIDPTGRWLVAGNQKSNTLVVFGIDLQTGRLAPIGQPVAAGGPVSILFLP